MHGSGAPQVKEKAAERLREGVMPMLATLYRLANDDSVPPAVQLAAVRDWLDRSGIKEHIVVEVEVKPWERLVDGIVAEVDDDDIARAARVLVASDVLVGELGQDDDEATPAALPHVPSRRQRQKVTWG